jgi:peptidoglycan/xylan/chitin deacetylase (PgdA/CDA1 family)
MVRLHRLHRLHRRHRLAEAVTGILLGAIAIAAIISCTATYVPHKQEYPFIPTVNAIGVPETVRTPAADTTSASLITSIPVLSYHQMDNGCHATASQCSTPVYSQDSVTQRQFFDELSWLHSHGYQTVTADEYVRWATGQPVLLPAKPVLLTVDDGIANFYGPATPVLKHFGYTMVSMIVSGYAEGAQEGKREFQGWDATWTQLRNLPSDIWEFAFHAGPHGHDISKASCPYFYSCQRPAESAAAYQARVIKDVNAGIVAEQQHLGSRVNTRMWAVPFNDLAQAGAQAAASQAADQAASQTASQTRAGDRPAAWLDKYAAQRFAVVFADGLAAQANQHYRYEIHGTDSVAYFASQVQRTDLYTRFSGQGTPGGPDTPSTVPAVKGGSDMVPIGVYTPDEATTWSGVTEFARRAGQPVRYVVYYLGPRDPFPARLAADAAANGAELILQLEPTMPMAQVAAGGDDDYLASLAAEVRGYGHPVILSWAAEANGNWYQYGAPHTSVSDYRAAWEHVMRQFRQCGNVTWMATINRTYDGAGKTMDYVIPGADMYGIDAYYNYRNDTFDSVFGPTMRQIRAVTNKPILISETGIGQLGDQARSIPGLIKGVRDNHLAGLVYFNVNEGIGNPYHQNWALTPAGMKSLRDSLRHL